MTADDGSAWPIRRQIARFADGWRRLRPILGDQRRFVAAIAACSLLAGVAEAGVLAVVAHVASTMSADGDRAGLAFGPFSFEAATPTLLTVAACLAVVRLLLQLALARMPAGISGQIQSRLRFQLFDAYLGTSRTEREAVQDGHLQELMGGHVAQAGQALLQLANGVAAALTFATLVLAALVLSVGVALVVIATALLLFVGLRPLSRSVRRHSAATARASISQASGVADTVRLAEEVEVFGVEEAERSRVQALVTDHQHKYVHTRILTRAIPVLYQSAVVFLLVAGLALAYLVDTTEFADLGAVVLLLVRASSYGQQFQMAYQGFGETLPYVRILDDAVARLHAGQLPAGDREIRSVQTVEFAAVSFAYPRARLVLHDIDFRIDAGEFVGVVGPSGAGKSTLAQLLLRLREPTSGAYLVNGHDAKEFDPADWRRNVTYLPQDPRLLDGTVEENIRFNREWITREAIERASRMAHIADEILGWEHGYETMIGHRVDAVSGGQRQRICMARALAGAPSLLLLDEPTSALDARSDQAISQTLGDLRGAVTTVVIAHRASTLELCDKVMVIRDGRVEAFDTRERVYELSDFYRRSTTAGADWGDLEPSLEGLGLTQPGVEDGRT